MRTTRTRRLAGLVALISLVAAPAALAKGDGFERPLDPEMPRVYRGTGETAKAPNTGKGKAPTGKAAKVPTGEAAKVPNSEAAKIEARKAAARKGRPLGTPPGEAGPVIGVERPLPEGDDPYAPKPERKVLPEQ